MRVRFAMAGLLLGAISPSPLASAQSQPDNAANSAAYVPTMTFDVASVRETPEANSYTVMATDDPHSSMMRLQNFAVYNLLSNAYGVQIYQIVNLPQWPPPAMFTINAKSDADADAKLAKLSTRDARLEKQHALQMLLADRFKLQVHWETREGDVLHLLVGKGGPKLAPAGSTPAGDREKQWMGAADGGEVKLLPIHQQSHGPRAYDYVGHSCSMDLLIPYLASEFGRPVIDKTGLTGKYDFLMTYRGTWESDRPADSTITVPTLDRALQNDLGLQIEKAKGPIQVLVIDHIEKPTEN